MKRRKFSTGVVRCLEVLTALGTLFVLLPVLSIIVVSIALTSRGPVIFRQQRIGLRGKPFIMLKFRTMRVNHDDLQVTASGDDRVTGVGRILRRFKLDELPELWNVVRGDLSLVGHRPEVPRYVDLEDPGWRTVLEERPGITHPVTLRLTDEERLIAEADGDAERFYVEELLPFKLKGYVEYKDRRSFWTDVEVLTATAAALVGWRWYAPVALEEVQAAASGGDGKYD